MKSFTEFNESVEYLEEKLIMLSNGKKYGQIVFLAGGAGSGKGFAASNFMQSDLFKIRDVDEWKLAFLKIAKMKDKYPEIQGLDLKKPADVGKLHVFLDKKGIKDRTMDLLLKGMKKDTLPNIMFDITAKDVMSVAKMMPDLLRAGYNPANIHMVWVLTNYQVAIKNNAGRARVVPDDIMLQTHSGAANTMFNIIQKKGKKLAINGELHVILNNRENTIMWKAGDKSKSGKQTATKYTNKPDKKAGVIKDFTYITLKKRGKPMMSEKDVLAQLHRWIVSNIPETELQKQLKDMNPDDLVLNKP
jgi:hypothetical protein